MAGSSSSGCGASTPTRRWIDADASFWSDASALNHDVRLHIRESRGSGFASRPGTTTDNLSGMNSALLAQAHDHVDPRDLVTLGHLGHLLQNEMRVLDVDEFVVVLEIKVVMRRDVGVEIG